MLGRFLLTDIFRVNSSASSPRSPSGSARIRAESAGVRRTFAERSPDVRRSPPKNIFGGRPADPRGTGRSPRGFARIHGGSSSAEPIAAKTRTLNITHSHNTYLQLHIFAKYVLATNRVRIIVTFLVSFAGAHVFPRESISVYRKTGKS